MHVLFFCHFSRAVWMQVSAGGATILTSGITEIASIFERWMIQAQQQPDQLAWLNVAMIVSWTIWNERCELVFQDKQVDPIITARKAISFSNYISKLHSVPPNRNNDSGMSRIHLPTWKPPAHPYFTINCDASFDAHTRLTGIAFILRYFAGNWRGCKPKCYAGIKYTEQAECLALLDVVSWCVESQLSHVVFETDLQGIEGSKNLPQS
ncbi:uncharacterized protein LOC113311234 [Papaver somniferum]|uniref:uncharacterized protein LOC113311234 n=1 Tax=Papaver somniferum TaxID=3469 RepID=UPI000E6FC46B|nr:uncharacterized protein LOC113311234 [Papaver somniferum]